jgi:hypothetical protein
MNDPLRRTEVTNWLNWIVNTWRLHLHVEQETAHMDQGSNCLTCANKVLTRLDHCKPYLLPDVQTYNMIVHVQ